MDDGSRRAAALELLRRAVGDRHVTFRDGQWEAIERLVFQRARLLLVQRTGWGKSLVYFLATKMLRDAGAGPALLISPLLALMRNQVAAAQRLGVRALSMNSANTAEWPAIVDALRRDEADILLVSPERLANQEFREQVLATAAQRIGLFVVDEAHCISDWGHDFRPDYQRISRVLQALPRNLPVLATTATANDRVVEDIACQLGDGLRVVRGPLARTSLRLQNLVMPNQAERMAWLAEQLPRMPGSGIVYVLTVREATRVSGWLRQRGINAPAYYGDLPTAQREELEQRLLANDVKALVATTALSMGFDKPDLGFVVHFQRPASVVHYYQQVGRAGRALPTALGVMMCGSEDDEISDYFIRTAFPPEAHVHEVLGALRSAEDGLSVAAIERAVNLTRTEIEKVLKYLDVRSPSPVAKIGSAWHATAVPYEPDLERVRRITELRYAEQRQMHEYATHSGCLMEFLARALDDPHAQPCGKCANCVGRPLLDGRLTFAIATEAAQYLRHNPLAIEARKMWPGDALAAHGWKGRIGDGLRAKDGMALCLWGDWGWGRLVKDGKQLHGAFDDLLVDAAAKLVGGTWRPDPPVQWVTCVPSLTHERLVPSFAERLANRLGLPFRACVKKVRHTEPQKLMRNSYRQASNLAGAFQVDKGVVMSGPVLLVDDIVDSRWTITVVAALLREAGAGPVFPFALAAMPASGDS